MNNNKVFEFKGPIFLIGMPRSGTKLLRGLLNEHPRISIPTFETEFFPYWVKHWKGFSDLSVRENFMKFYSEMLKVPYFNYCLNEDKVIEESIWYELCDSFTPSDVFEALVRHDVKAPVNTNIIWGDKSPSYITSLELIKQQFPNAKFIHIIRDVRDYCLSINHAWKKNMIRAAQRWNDNVQQAREISRSFSEDYLELLYENLLDEPEEELKKICKFLNVPFDASMLNLSSPTENIGATMGDVSIVRSNKKKYEKAMSESLQYKIEAIAHTTLESLGYPVSNKSYYYRVSKYRMGLYQIFDGFNLFITTIKRIGVIETVKYIYGALIISRK